MMKDITEKIEIPEKVEVSVDGFMIKVKGEKGENERSMKFSGIEIKKEGDDIIIISKKPTKREKKMVFTFKAHIKNMIKGVSEGFVYKLKVCSSHFPMKASIKDKEVVIKNFFGEKIDRRAKLLEGVNGKVEGDIIVMEGIDREKVGQSAANVEKATQIKNRDKRIFQDGVYIIEKAGKELK